jgi:large subunit ribosomal protein L23|tara:strand:- start:1496 stop:1789 length:294 start_codon:yes stop_codon:yes gene_type:complete
MSKINLYDSILNPFLTEKSTSLSEMNKVVFKVNRQSNKRSVKKSIEKIFKVDVVKVNIVNKQGRVKISRGKKIKVRGYKKAIVTLKKGQNIDLTTGI